MPKLLNVGVKAAVVNNGKVLLLRRTSNMEPGTEFWDLPGGRIEQNESITETLGRELKEEILNMNDYTVGELLHVWRHDTDFPEGHGLLLVCYRVEANLEQVELSDEHSDYVWVSSADAEVLRRPKHAQVQRLREHQIKVIKAALS